jgi:hypothetical protein
VRITPAAGIMWLIATIDTAKPHLISKRVEC